MNRLGPDQVISVNLPTTFGRHADLLHFRVVAVIDSVVALDPMVRADMRLIPDRVRNCYLTFGHGSGLVGLKGHLYERSPGDWRFKVTDPVSFPTENGFRIRVCAPITVRPFDHLSPGTPIETETVRIGIDGVLIDGGGVWVPPAHVRLTLSLPGYDDAIEASGHLAATQGVLCDFKYEAMDASTRNRLGAFMIDYQRAGLRRQAWLGVDVGGFDDDVDV